VCPLSGGGCWAKIKYGHEQEKSADTKEVIRTRNSKKDRHHNGQNEKEQTTLWPKEKGQTTQWPNEKGQTTIYKALHRKLKIE
jgi:hypothetical protein